LVSYNKRHSVSSALVPVIQLSFLPPKPPKSGLLSLKFLEYMITVKIAKGIKDKKTKVIYS